MQKWKTTHNATNHTGGGDGDDPITDQTDPSGAKRREKLEAFKRGWIYKKFEEV